MMNFFQHKCYIKHKIKILQINNTIYKTRVFFILIMLYKTQKYNTKNVIPFRRFSFFEKLLTLSIQIISNLKIELSSLKKQFEKHKNNLHFSKRNFSLFFFPRTQKSISKLIPLKLKIKK